VTTGPIDAPPRLSRLSPTDVSQFLRLEQCERYLRLQLHARAGDGRLFKAEGVSPQAIPPLLTRSGAEFERTVMESVTSSYAPRNIRDFAALTRPRTDAAVDNEEVVDLARSLPRGGPLFLFQPRLLVDLDGWAVRGDVDILRLERDRDGRLHALIADMKSSTSAKVEHRLQVAFYREMLAALFASHGVPYAAIAMAVLYRGVAVEAEGRLDRVEKERREAEHAAAARFFGSPVGQLDLLSESDRGAYGRAVRDLVTGPDSTAARVAATPFDDLPYHLTPECDGCLYNEFCLKRSARNDDLSLLAHLSRNDKEALKRGGVVSTRVLAGLKTLPMRGEPLAPVGDAPALESHAPAPGDDAATLTSVPAHDALVKRLAATWPIGPRLDEMIHRARRHRQYKGDKIAALPFIPSKGYGSLPYANAAHNPNLVRVYIDVQTDYLHDRVYLLAALVSCCENGVESPERRRSIVRLTTAAPSAETEGALFEGWIEATIAAIVELAAPGAEGRAEAPIHLIFYSALAQRLLLEGLGRHAAHVLGATPLYDFVTQFAAFDSPVVTTLEHEIRELKNYPLICQSLQIVAAYLKFDWNTPAPYREIFRERLFDFWGKLDPDEKADDEESAWYTRRARFNSQIPLEFAYASWNDLRPPREGERDAYAPYRAATLGQLTGFAARRLEAIEHVARDFSGNKMTEKSAFALPDLHRFSARADTLAQALLEFLTVERHTVLGRWKTAHLAPPERRVLSGETLIGRYDPAGQPPGMASLNRENRRRHVLKEELKATPGAEGDPLLKAKRKEARPSVEGLTVRLPLETANCDCTLDEMLSNTRLRVGETVVVSPRLMVDSRLPVTEQVPLTPTPKSILWGMRGEIKEIVVERDETRQALAASVVVEMRTSFGGKKKGGYTFGSIERPFDDGALYTLDSDPNDWYGAWCFDVARGVAAGDPNALYDRLAPGDEGVSTHDAHDHAVAPEERLLDAEPWIALAAEGQARFLRGLDALHEGDAFHGLEESKRLYIGSYGEAPTLLVQGPPGTGKSYATAFAVFARIQGALAAGRDLRVIVSCKTHAATDVLLTNIVRAKAVLDELIEKYPDLTRPSIDRRALDVPLYRVAPRDAPPAGATALYKKGPPGVPLAVDVIREARWCIVAATPGGVRRMLNDKWGTDLAGHGFCDLLVLDEASQMNLPEALMAALPLARDGRLIVVGDHRQMPPIVAHDWNNEMNKTFSAFRSYESLFRALLERGVPIVRFAESFRLHADMAAFLRREVYSQDGIPYFSRRRETLPPFVHDDPFVAAVLSPAHALVVVVHDEGASQVRNPFEQALITPVLEALADPATYNYGPERDLGVVAPHRAQKTALRDGVPALTKRDASTGEVLVSAVDTVERFQGDEREAIVVSTTESDRQYVLTTSDFLLDPRRLTVALSRAKRKMVLVAARSVFTLFSTDDETFAHAQLWKNLLTHTCIVPLWAGERHGHHVQVWGSTPTRDAEAPPDA